LLRLSLDCFAVARNDGSTQKHSAQGASNSLYPQSRFTGFAPQPLQATFANARAL